MFVHVTCPLNTGTKEPSIRDMGHSIFSRTVLGNSGHLAPMKRAETHFCQHG